MRFIFAFFLLLVLGGFPALAQTPLAYDTTYQGGTYNLRYEQFQGFPNAPTDVIFLGNSITDFVEWAELLDLPTARNRGISGDITFGILNRLEEITEGKPAKVFLLIGVNDISRNIPNDVILQNIQKIVTRIKASSPKTKIYLQTILPTNNTFNRFKNHYNKEDKIQAVNQGLKELAAAQKVTLIDLYPQFLDNEQRLKKDYTHDGLHLTMAGYQKWADILKKGGYLK